MDTFFPEKFVLILRKGHLASNTLALVKQLHLYAPPF